MVSGGRGHLGECGGINNPIHYTRYNITNTTKSLSKKFFRVKKLAVWIVNSIGEESQKLCWDEDFQQKMRKMYGN